MITFSLAFLIHQALRIPSHPVLWATLTAGCLAVFLAWWGSGRHLRGHVLPALLGVALGVLLPSARGIAPTPHDGMLGPYAVTQTVAGGAHELDGDVRFELADGLEVWVENSRAAPFPGDRVHVVGSWLQDGRRFRALSSEAVTITSASSWHYPPRVLERLRRNLRDRLVRGLPQDTAAFLRAVALGDRALPKDERRWCATAGVLHLIAVSGSHLSLVLAGLSCLTRRAGVLAIAISLYALLTGLEAPVLRSLIPALATLLGRARARHVAPLPWLFLSAVVVVAFDRTALTSPGFQLSWCAFAALPTTGADGFRGQFIAGGRAAIATLPIIAWHFLRVPLVGIPATMLLAPIIPFLLLLAALLMAFPGNPVLVPLAAHAVRGLLGITEWIASLPMATFDVSRCHPIWPGLLLASLALISWVPHTRWRRAVVWIAVLALIGLLVPHGPRDGIHPIPAGRGSASLFVERGVVVLVDTGPPEARVVESLRRRGVSRLDAIIVTHADIDHAGGLPAALSAFGPCPVIGPRVARSVTKHHRWHDATAGQSIAIGTMTFDIAGPHLESKARGTNESGLIATARVAGLVALITGDAEDTGLREALPHLPREVDLLWLPHHGSESRELPALLARVKPKIAIASGREIAYAACTRALIEGLGIPFIHVTPGSEPRSFP